MVPTVYIFVSGGLVQDVRSDHPVAVHVIDYDNIEDNDEYAHLSAEEQEVAYARDVCGKTQAEIEASTKEVW